MTVDIGVERGEVTPGPTAFTVFVFLSLALYNVIELTFIIWGYFKRYGGLYFWSFNVATYGVGFYALGYLLKATLPIKGTYAYITMVAVGWMAMVLGQSLVLWSRLHLVLRDEFKLKMILWFIIVNSICFFIPILLLLYGTNSSHPHMWIGTYGIYENIQVSMFAAQELVLSLVYIYETIKLARLHRELRLAWRSRRLMIHLIAVNVAIVLLDIPILVLEYCNLYAFQTAYKGFVYSIKLKLEFTVLNRLKEMTTGRKDSSDTNGSSPSDNDLNRRRSAGAMTQTASAGDMIPPSRSASWPIRPPSAAYHAYAQGRWGFGDLETQDTGDGTSTDTDVVATSEVIVEQDILPGPVSRGSL